MQHHNKNRKLGRVKRQRVALLKSLARSLVLHDGITTTAAKAKELKPFIEKLVTASKTNSVASRRVVSSRIGSPEAVKKLHETIAPRYSARSGGYTRVTLLGRKGSRVAEMARIEFVA